MLDKTLVSFCTYNSPAFLNHFLKTLENVDAGAPFDLLIFDNENTDAQALKALDHAAKKYRVETTQNLGRAQYGYLKAFLRNANYKSYFFLHDDSAFIKNDWLKKGLERLQDLSVEPVLQNLPDAERIDHLPVGKIGYQAYRWGRLDRYLDTQFQAIFRYMQPVADILGIKIPHVFQHSNDDRVLLTNEALQASQMYWNIEYFRMDLCVEKFAAVNNFFQQTYPGNGWIQPKNIYYGADWDGFQTTSEFLNDILPMRFGYRSHALIGDGTCQELEGYSSFWGNEYVAHFGSHNVFKRLGFLLKMDESEVRSRYADPIFLQICTNLIAKETANVG